MKALVHWMVSFAKLHLIPPMMTLLHKILLKKASAQKPQASAPRVMTDHELLLSLHQKVDHNHKWVNRQFASILCDMTMTHDSMRKNHYYVNEILNRTWAILSHLKTLEELNEMDLQHNFD